MSLILINAEERPTFRAVLPQQIRPQPRHADHDEIDGDDEVEQTRNEKDEDSGNESDRRLQMKGHVIDLPEDCLRLEHRHAFSGSVHPPYHPSIREKSATALVASRI